ncbi:protein eva-1 homolog C isoform X2 [Chelonus insularis]|uniref:protein eva-1 homolog C isoform X2 n=1 Tax=Chelonus insularis TaxID=460826 RepID=UPI00158E64D0|nr:protein eva-1 homolog C isoform X2 [Chelonus insularis]
MPALLVSLMLGLQLAAAQADNLGLLSGTLKAYQRAACDEETMSLRCPPGTSISIVSARYKRVLGSKEKCFNDRLDLSISNNALTNETCQFSNALEYSLLQTVVEICQKKRNCKFNTHPKNQNDPCPQLAKYTEVTYKCRPYEFRSKVACENDAVNLVCNPGSRVAIFSASYGRTEYESLQCPQPHGVKEETCTAPHATEIVLKLCHGKRKCSVTANSATFGDTCNPETRSYLKVIYTCVPRSVLREQFVGDLEPDEVDLVPEFDEGFDRTDFKTEFSPSPNLENPEPPPRDNETIDSTTVDSSLPRARTNNDRNQEKFYLYIIVSVAAGVTVFLSLIIGRLLISRHRAKKDTKFHDNNETLPNGFTDEISEIDADIDLSTPVPVPMQETRIPETQLAERLHGTDHYYPDVRMPVSIEPIHQIPPHAGVRVDLGNHMIGADSLHTILSTENLRNISNKGCYYYG